MQETFKSPVNCRVLKAEHLCTVLIEKVKEYYSKHEVG